jgi:hypothetical protein
MLQPGVVLRWCSTRGDATGAARRAPAATATAVAALSVLAACAASSPPRADEARAIRIDVEAGLDLYEAGDFELAARRFRSAGDAAARCGDLSMQTRAVTAECTAWLRARRSAEFAVCTQRLEPLQARRPRSDPGVNTLLALGAVAGGRPLPPHRIPNAVRPFVLEAAQESR